MSTLGAHPLVFDELSSVLFLFLFRMNLKLKKTAVTFTERERGREESGTESIKSIRQTGKHTVTLPVEANL